MLLARFSAVFAGDLPSVDGEVAGGVVGGVVAAVVVLLVVHSQLGQMVGKQHRDPENKNMAFHNFPSSCN